MKKLGIFFLLLGVLCLPSISAESNGDLLWKYKTGNEVDKTSGSTNGSYKTASSRDGHAYFITSAKLTPTATSTSIKNVRRAIVIRDFSDWTTGSGYTVDTGSALSFNTYGISQAYKRINKTVIKKGDKILIEFELDHFSDYSTRTILLGGFTKDLSFRDENQGWWWSSSTDGLYLAIHTACLGCLEGYTKPYVFEFYAVKNNKFKKLFNTQWENVNKNCEYGRYLFEIEVAENGTIVRLFKIENDNRVLVEEVKHDFDLSGIELNYARVWNEKMQKYSSIGTYRGKIYELSILPQTYKETPSEEIKDLGIITYQQAPKTWAINIPSNFTKVEVGVYGYGEETQHKYGGWNAYLKINGKYAWKFLGKKDEKGRFLIYDYILGKEVPEVSGKGAYLDATSMFHPGKNTITYYHFTGGDGIGVKVRIYTGNETKTSPANKPPVIDSFKAFPTSGTVPLTVTFTCAAHDSDGSIAEYRWDFDGDGVVDKITTTGRISHTYEVEGTYYAFCRVVDNRGVNATSSPVKITIEKKAIEENPAQESFMERVLLQIKRLIKSILELLSMYYYHLVQK